MATARVKIIKVHFKYIKPCIRKYIIISIVRYIIIYNKVHNYEIIKCIIMYNKVHNYV